MEVKAAIKVCFLFNPPVIKHSPSSDPISGALWLFASFLILDISRATQNFLGQFQYQRVCGLASQKYGECIIKSSRSIIKG